MQFPQFQIRNAAIPAVLLATLFLGACEWTLIYSERTGFKLGISVNDDPATPVEVNAGLKRTVVGFVPPREGVEESNGKKQAKGEAVSLFSGFKMEYEQNPGNPLGGDLTVRTQFASGVAAINAANDPETVKNITTVKFQRSAEFVQKQEEVAALLS